MPDIVDPFVSMPSFQQALLDGELNVDRCVTDTSVVVYQDKPQDQMRLTYARVTPDNVVQAMAIFTPVEPIEGKATFQVGYAVAPEFRGQGLAKSTVETGIAEMKIGFGRHGMSEFWVEAVIGADNAASRGVAEAVLAKEGKATTDGASGVDAFQYARLVK